MENNNSPFGGQSNENPRMQEYGMLFSSKGFIISLIVGALIVILSVGALFSSKSTTQYQGMIKLVEEQNQKIQRQ